MPKSTIVASMAVWALIALAGCSRDASEHKQPASTPAAPHAQSGDEGKVIATYGTKRLTQGDFAREIERLPPRSRTQLTTPERKRQFVDNFILNDLLASEGNARGYDKDPEIERQIDELRRRLIVQRVMKDFQEPPEVSDADASGHVRTAWNGLQGRTVTLTDPTTQAVFERTGDDLSNGLYVQLPPWGWHLFRVEPNDDVDD